MASGRFFSFWPDESSRGGCKPQASRRLSSKHKKGSPLPGRLGNTLNLALNLLGCYVHDMRLQFLEFFGRFYKDGGKAFRPLCMRSNYVEIMKEEHEQ